MSSESNNCGSGSEGKINVNVADIDSAPKIIKIVIPGSRQTKIQSLKEAKEPKTIIRDNGSIAYTLEGYSEIPWGYLEYVHGSWIKYINKDTGNHYSGGFLVSCDFNTSVKTIVLRVPNKQELLEIEVNGMYFYIKSDTPNFMSIKRLFKRINANNK